MSRTAYATAEEAKLARIAAADKEMLPYAQIFHP